MTDQTLLIAAILSAGKVHPDGVVLRIPLWYVEAVENFKLHARVIESAGCVEMTLTVKAGRQ